MDPRTFLILFAVLLLIVYILLRGGSNKPSPKIERVTRQPRKRTGTAANTGGLCFSVNA